RDQLPLSPHHPRTRPFATQWPNCGATSKANATFLRSFPGCDAMDLALTKVDVNYNGETKKKVNDGQYRPAPNDQLLDAKDIISHVWERPRDDQLHIFVSPPGGVGNPPFNWPHSTRFLSQSLPPPACEYYLYPHLFTHINISGHISAKQYGLSFVQKAEEILVYPGSRHPRKWQDDTHSITCGTYPPARTSGACRWGLFVAC
ncbi:hypothetical protein BGY98DRAFT_1121814, partial [Russula aff. rugulosa BPL654]